MPKVTPAYHALSQQLPIHPPSSPSRSSFFPHPVSSFRSSLSLSHSMDRPYFSFFFPPSSLFSFTFRRRLTVVSCFFYRLAPVLRAIQPTLYEKTLKSFFATGRASWLLLQPETAATVSSDAIRKLGENASIYAYITCIYIYIYIREKIARYSFSAILSNSLSPFFVPLDDLVSRSFPPFSLRLEVSRKRVSKKERGANYLLSRFEHQSGLVGAHEEVEMIATRFPPIKLDKLFLGLLG